MFCPTCGSQLNDNAKFCSACGSAVPSNGPAPAPQPQTNTDQSTAAASSFGGAAAANAPQQSAYTAQPDANASFAAAGAQTATAGTQAVSAAKTALVTSKFKNPFFIGALAASVLLVLTLFMPWIRMSSAGSTTAFSGLNLGAEDGGVWPRLIALLGLVSIGTLLLIRSPKTRSTLGIVGGSLSLICAVCETSILNTRYIESSAGQFMNSSFASTLAGSNISLGSAGGFVMIASVALIALNVKMFLDAKKATEIAA